jgi:hypothetical protein
MSSVLEARSGVAENPRQQFNLNLQRLPSRRLCARLMSQNLTPRTFGRVGASRTPGIGWRWRDWLGVTIAPCEFPLVVLEST